jgi:hypothetical protein
MYLCAATVWHFLRFYIGTSIKDEKIISFSQVKHKNSRKKYL